MAEFYRRAQVLYATGGKAVAGAEALSRGGKALEAADPERACRLWLEACDIFEEEEKHSFAMDTFRAAEACMVKREQWVDAVQIFLRHAQARPAAPRGGRPFVRRAGHAGPSPTDMRTCGPGV